MPPSRIGVLQPAREGVILEALIQADSAGFANHADRLNPAHEAFDLTLRLRFVEAYADHLVRLLHQAGAAGCCLVLLPECSLPLGSPGRVARGNLIESCRRAEPLWLERITPLARQYGMLIASCYYRAEGDRLYNDAVLVDEAGEVIGIYHKVHLPCPLDWELTEAGVFTAGKAYPVFETSVGKVGFLICYDVDFAEAAACLALNGAEILLHPTVGYNFPDEEEVVGEARLRTRATDNHLALAYANFGPAPGRSAIYSHSGAQVACCGRLVDALAVADLDLRAPRVQDWGDLGRHDHRDQLTRKRRPDTYGVLAERRPPLLEAAHGPEGRLYEYREDVGLP